MDPWITDIDAFINEFKRNGLLVTKKDAEEFLKTVNWDELFKKHEPRVKVEVWKGEPINGVDVKNHPDYALEDRLSKEIEEHRKFIESIQDPVQKNALQHIIDEKNEELRKVRIRNASRQFLRNGTGNAYKIYIDGKLTVFQPHVPRIQGFHAMTSKTNYHGKVADKCPSCGAEHPIEDIMEQERIATVKQLASEEISTKFLYIAQELTEKRITALDKLSELS